MSKRGKPRKGSVDVQKLVIPLEDIKSISDRDRYSYYLLGHMFNELMCLQELIFYALPRHGDTRDYRRRPELAQAMFLFRVALSKISEVRKELKENNVLKSTFETQIFPHWVEGRQRLQRVDAALAAANWLSKLRTKVGFHFPTFKQWEPYVKPTETWEPDIIFLSRESGNVFYDASNDVVAHWMFSMYGVDEATDAIAPMMVDEVKKAIDPMIAQMIDLVTLMDSYLEDSIGVMIDKSIFRNHDMPVPCGPVVAPQFADVQIPFWTQMSPSKLDSE